MYNNIKLNWRSKYDEILNLNKRDLLKNSTELMLPFPNAYSFTKRMAEQLLVLENTKNIPISFVRPSIIGAAAEEPCIGWTDTLGLISGASVLIGLGILKDMTGNESLLCDVIPVDYVGKQAIVQAAYANHLYRTSNQNYFVTHSSTSSANPVNWKHYMESLVSYMNDFPYDQRLGRASFTFHKTD
jgi:alcohol-forming fatty acyl-CoA reductase